MPDHYSVHLTFSWCHSQTTWCNNFLPNWSRTVLPSNPCGSRRHPEHADSDTYPSVCLSSFMPFGTRNSRWTFQRFTQPRRLSCYLNKLTPCKQFIKWAQFTSAICDPASGQAWNICQHRCIWHQQAYLSWPFHLVSASPVLNHTHTESWLLKSSHLWILICQLCESLCLVNYYHHFVPWHCAILHPLHFLPLIHRSAAIELPWTKHARAAFQGSRDTLVTPWIP